MPSYHTNCLKYRTTRSFSSTSVSIRDWKPNCTNTMRGSYIVCFKVVAHGWQATHYYRSWREMSP